MLSLMENVSGEAFEELMSACFLYADSFSLTKNGWGADKSRASRELMQKLAPYYLRTIRTDHWFCYRVPGGQEIEVFLFRACGAARRILLERYRCLFSGDAPWELPEDLCFFRNGTLILGSVSHEDICFAYDERTAVCGRWETALPDAAEQIRLHPNENKNIKENHL